MGRPVSAAFEAQVLALLVLEGRERVVNVAYSYEVVRIAARTVQAGLKWAGHPLVSRLAFSNMWVRGWLRRAGLRRRRVTCVEKAVPSAAAIEARMRAIQERIVAGGYELRDVRSADETGVWFGAAPRYQYVGAGVRRGSAPPSDDRARFTAHLNGSADGTMHPPFIIVRCSAAGRDLSGTRVLQGLRDVHGFDEVAGWSLREWRRELTTHERGGKAVTAEHVRPYLMHLPSGAVITLNATAWMRTPEMCMWADTQLAPQQAAARRPMLVVVDNAGAHCTAAVERVFREHGIALELLPKNVTDTLQVMDLVVNGPLKAALRARRAAALFAALQAHRSVGGRGGAAAWTPPKPSVADALRGVMEAHAVNFFTPAFCAGLRRSFVAVGLAPVDQSSSGISPSGGASGSGGGVSLGRS